MTVVRKYKALGEMVPRSKSGGAEFVRLDDYEALEAINLQLVEALETIASMYDHEKTGPEMAHNMYSARCIALQALRVIKGERG